MDDRLRTRCLGEAQGSSQQSQNTRDRAKADAGLSKELQGEVDDVDLGSSGEAVLLRLKLSHAGLRRLEGASQLIALGFDACLLSSLVALPRAVLLGFLFPLISAVFHFGQLAHDASLRAHPDGPPPWRGQIGLQMS